MPCPPDCGCQPPPPPPNYYYCCIRGHIVLVTAEECQAKGGQRFDSLEEAIKRAAQSYAQKSLAIEREDTPLLDTSKIVGTIKTAEYEERVRTSLDKLNAGKPMYKLHARLEFDDQVYAVLRDQWHEIQVVRRMQYAGAGAVSVFFVLGGLYTYLKLGSAGRSSHRGAARGRPCPSTSRRHPSPTRSPTWRSP